MRYVRFTARSFVEGRIYEPGDEGMVADNVFGAHIVDVASGDPTHHLPAGFTPDPGFLDHTSDTPHASGGMIASSSTEVTEPPVREDAEKDG